MSRPANPPFTMNAPVTLSTSASVVIVNYNAGAMLTECVRSVLSSSIPVQIYVSDNGSEDGSIQFLHTAIGEHPSVIIQENSKNLGFAKGNNAVLSLCQGDYLLFLNPDCVIGPKTLEQMIGALEDDPSAGMAGCLIVNPDGSEQAGCRRYVPTPWRSLVRVFRLHRIVKNHPRFQSFVMAGLPLPTKPVSVEAISGAFMLVRRSALEAVGPMDDGYFLHCEDIDWCMRFRAIGLKILFVPYISIIHWKGFSSTARPIRVELHKHRGMIRFYYKFFRHQYPGILMYIVVVAVWLRFFAKAFLLMLKTPLRIGRPRWTKWRSG